MWLSSAYGLAQDGVQGLVGIGGDGEEEEVTPDDVEEPVQEDECVPEEMEPVEPTEEETEAVEDAEGEEEEEFEEEIAYEGGEANDTNRRRNRGAAGLSNVTVNLNLSNTAGRRPTTTTRPSAALGNNPLVGTVGNLASSLSSRFLGFNANNNSNTTSNYNSNSDSGPTVNVNLSNVNRQTTASTANAGGSGQQRGFDVNASANLNQIGGAVNNLANSAANGLFGGNNGNTNNNAYTTAATNVISQGVLPYPLQEQAAATAAAFTSGATGAVPDVNLNVNYQHAPPQHGNTGQPTSAPSSQPVTYTSSNVASSSSTLPVKDNNQGQGHSDNDMLCGCKKWIFIASVVAAVVAAIILIWVVVAVTASSSDEGGGGSNSRDIPSGGTGGGGSGNSNVIGVRKPASPSNPTNVQAAPVTPSSGSGSATAAAAMTPSPAPTVDKATQIQLIVEHLNSVTLSGQTLVYKSSENGHDETSLTKEELALQWLIEYVPFYSPTNEKERLWLVQAYAALTLYAPLFAEASGYDVLAWNSETSDECSPWFGISCTEQEYGSGSGSGSGTDTVEVVTEIVVQSSTYGILGPTLAGTLSPDLGLLTHLETISLGLNGLTGTLPSTIGLLTRLTTFDVYSNSLTGTIPTEIASWADISSLSFSSTALSGTIPDTICDTLVYPTVACGIECSCCTGICF